MAPVEARRQSHPDAHRESFTQRPRGCFERVDVTRVGMPLVHRPELPECIQLIDGCFGVAQFRHGGVKYRRRVALGKNEPVPVYPRRVLGIDLHVVEKQFDDDLDGGKRPSRVP